jgi:phosphoribosylglycinamide formyltransferase-1
MPSSPQLPQTVTRLAFLISGSASHVLAIAEAIANGRLPGCEIAIVVCNIPGAPGADAARAAGLTTVTMEGRGREQHDHEEAIDALFRRMRVDLICMAGYLRVLSTAFLRRWPGRVLSVHPSLLPAFPRAHAPAAALDFGVRVTGCTVFFVDESVDGGLILEQHAVSVLEDDTEATLTERIQHQEHEAYICALARVIAGTHKAIGRRYLPTNAESRH